jgi:hypothetical protein
MKTSSAREECRLAACSAVQELYKAIQRMNKYSAAVANRERAERTHDIVGRNRRPAIIRDCMHKQGRIHAVQEWARWLRKELSKESSIGRLSDANSIILKDELQTLVRYMRGVNCPEEMLVLLERYRDLG